MLMPALRAVSFCDHPWASMRSHRACGSDVGRLGGFDLHWSVQDRLHPGLGGGTQVALSL